MSAGVLHFDTLEFLKKSKEFGVNEQLAEYQARQIEHAIDIAVTSAKAEVETRGLATKKDIKELELRIEQIDLKIEQVKADLKTEIYKTKSEIIIWVAGLLAASVIIQHFFK
ncbi:MAG: hypothetical protein KBD37_03525 [Burkholderiales bacterium]|nr:hypothetical protein [Burkholderiales bacterium]